MTSRRIAVALVLGLAGAALSGLLLLEHYGEGQSIVNSFCGEGPESGCAAVARSPHSKILGIPWAALGLFFYLSLAAFFGPALAAPAPTRDAAAGVGFVIVVVALAMDLALLGVQAFAVKAFCILCLATYAVNVGLAAALWPARRALSLGRRELGEVSGRLLAVAWAVGLVAFGAAVFAANQALVARAAARTATILGTPEPAPPVAGDSEGTRWQAEARRLKETLDDPQKLDQYLAEKRLRDWETAPAQRMDLHGVPSKGPANAPVQVVEFSDFLCPFCRQIAGAFAAFLPQSGNRVRLYFKNFPLDQACNPSLRASAHPGACWLALGGICAHYQDKFWPYHDRVFSTELKKPQLMDVVRLGEAVGINPTALGACMEDPRTKERLAAEIKEAQRLGVQSTPTLFVNGKKLPQSNDLLPVVDKEAQAKGFPPFPTK